MIEFPFPPRNVDASTQDWMSKLKDALDARFKHGTGSPEGVVVADIGCQYTNLSGGASTTLWVKESGNGLATGWIAK